MTDRQQSIFEYVCDFQAENGMPPSTREVARQFSVSQPTALEHLQALARADHLEKLVDGKWGLPIRTLQAFADVPVYGAIPAGLPAMQEQEPEETVRVDPAVFGVRIRKPGHFWFLRVTGESMIGARIFDGDLVALVRREPKEGEVIAALVDETTVTLKRFVREKGKVILRAANSKFKDIFPQSLECQGVVVGVLRRGLPA